MTNDKSSSQNKVSPKVEEKVDQCFKNYHASVFPEIGLSIFLFIHRLFQQAYSDQQRVLLFCSKEGELLLELFRRYQATRFGRQIIDSHYLIVSRKSTYICSLRSLKEEDFQRLFCFYRDTSAQEFLLSLNFSESQTHEICSELKIDAETRHPNFSQHEIFHTIISSSYFAELYEAHRQRQKENFGQYLNSFGIDFLEQGLTLVDVGWKGSIQNNIYYYLGSNISVMGYYLGLLSPTELKFNNQKKGILFSDVPTHSPFIHAYNNNRSLFEMILGASHGSADGYYTSEQATSTQRKDTCFYRELDGTHGRPAVMVRDLQEERTLFQERIAPIQKKIIELFQALTNLYVLEKGILPSFEWFARKHARIVFLPTREEIDYFTSLYHLENFGIFEFTEFSSSERVSLIQKIKNLNALKKNPAAFLETGVWPPIILRQLGLEFLITIEGRRRYRRVFNADT